MLPPGRNILRSLRVLRRLLLVLLITAISVPVQALLIAAARQRQGGFRARLLVDACAGSIGLKVQVIGAAGAPHRRRPADRLRIEPFLLARHPGARRPAGRPASSPRRRSPRWPLIASIARLGRTVFVSAAAPPPARERDDMRTRLGRGDNLILFPEGTTSDGSRVLPFRSAFLSIAELPVTAGGPAAARAAGLGRLRPAGRPADRARHRPLFAWYGDMDIGSHFWRAGPASRPARDRAAARRRSTRATSQPQGAGAATWEAVADGAAMLRQNRHGVAADAAGARKRRLPAPGRRMREVTPAALCNRIPLRHSGAGHRT